MTDHDPVLAPTAGRYRSQAYLSLEAVAAALGVSSAALCAWLRAGHHLGVRFELVSPLLALANDQLADELVTRPHVRARERLVLTADGVLGIEIDNPDQHARIDRHWEAVALAALTSDDRALRRFACLSVRGLPLASRLDQVHAWANPAGAS